MERRAISSVNTAILILFLQACTTFSVHDCPASSCGNIPNISYPFRLTDDPPHCGDKRYELNCENNTTVLTLFSGKFHVHHIDYKRYKIRVSDAGVMENATCSFIPHYFLSSHSFTRSIFGSAVMDPLYLNKTDASKIAYFNCSNPITDDSRYVGLDTTGCDSERFGYAYAVLEDSSVDLSVMDIKVGCQLKVATLVNWGTGQHHRKKENISYVDIHNMLAYGFRLSWLFVICEQQCGKWGNCDVINESTGEVRCNQQGNCRSFVNGTTNQATKECRVSAVFYYIRVIGFFCVGVYKGLLQIFGVKVAGAYVGNEVEIGEGMGRYVLPYFIVRFLLGVVAFIALLIYKWGRRHKSDYNNIEYFLQENTLMPIRYSYKEIKQMTRGFKEKLGQGGFGTVYKGKLRSGPFVAIKMLSKSKANGQDFINEVATIGRIHHANVVRLIGFCVEASKRALVYELMPNGSLDRHIFSKDDDSISLTYEQIYEISLGVARGIAYLHQGCDMQILHFDIKPHNILLDENFIPKVSDFGLAKLYPIDKSIVTLTAARGTIGYMAPELFYHNIGGVSYKADIYSFGMLLMEMASRRRNKNKLAGHSSESFFPLWIYDQLSRENDIETEDIIIEEMNNDAKKMFMVALWCIQLKPSDRPSMNKVVEMLEGELENIEMPPKPSLYPNEMIQEDLESNSDQTLSYDSMGSSSYLEEINPLDNDN